MKEHFCSWWGPGVGHRGLVQKEAKNVFLSFFKKKIGGIPQEPRGERRHVGFSFFYLKRNSSRDGSLREPILSCLEFTKCFNKKDQGKKKGKKKEKERPRGGDMNGVCSLETFCPSHCSLWPPGPRQEMWSFWRFQIYF